MFCSNPGVSKIFHWPTEFAGIHVVKGSAGEGGDSFRVCERERERAASGVESLCVSFFFFFVAICMAGYVTLPGLRLFPSQNPAQPTGGCAAVTQLLSLPLPLWERV